MTAMMLVTYLSITVALLVYIGTIVYCGDMRRRSGIKAPAMTGHPGFERAARIQQNTLEQLVVLVPAMWIFGLTINPLWSGLLGFIWSIGRVVYAVSYAKDPAKRDLGYAISSLPVLILVFGDLASTLSAIVMGAR